MISLVIDNQLRAKYIPSRLTCQSVNKKNNLQTTVAFHINVSIVKKNARTSFLDQLELN